MSDVEILIGDCRETLRRVADGSARCCVTSPPYWGLRDYGTGRWEGGDPDCDHTRGNPRRDHSHNEFLGSRGEQPSTAAAASPMLQACHCGAQRVDQQIGLEATPEEFVQVMVEVFREVRRALADDGTLWLNLGDCYAREPTKGGSGDGGKNRAYYEDNYLRARGAPMPNGLKAKDLLGMPWRVAFALQADGWWLRQEIIWAKGNPMPESVNDRPTRAHEQIFLLTKSDRYFYDAKAIAEPVTGNAHARGNGVNPKAQPAKNEKTEGQVKDHRLRAGFNERWKTKQNASFSATVSGLVETRNSRSVWFINSQPYSGAHFATFPEELARRCILAGSRSGDFVLDPFSGSGTTGAVALKSGRRFIGCELNPKYVELAERRLKVQRPLFAPGGGA